LNNYFGAKIVAKENRKEDELQGEAQISLLM
jgi:hypothetical protein